MDPRHPELAISRMRELMEQYDRVEKDMSKATTGAKLAELEREGALVVQEICLVAPRMHEAMMQTSRQRRHALAHGVVINMSKYKVPVGATGEEEGVVVGPTDQIIAVNEATTEEAEVVEKPVEKGVNEILVTPAEAVALVDGLELVSTDTKISDDKMSIEIEQTYKPKKKTTRKKKTTKKKAE